MELLEGSVFSILLKNLNLEWVLETLGDALTIGLIPNFQKHGKIAISGLEHHTSTNSPMCLPRCVLEVA